MKNNLEAKSTQLRKQKASKTSVFQHSFRRVTQSAGAEHQRDAPLLKPCMREMSHGAADSKETIRISQLRKPELVSP